MELQVKRQARQGDVLVTAVSALPEKCAPMARDNGDVVLAYGEVTGHAHRIKAPLNAIEYLRAENGDRYIQTHEAVALRHEEHAAMAFDANMVFQVTQQREYRYGFVRD